jgi:DNA primase
VVVEGYTDVMAAHLSGVDTAIASCGTAFGDDHARLLRRLMGDHDAFNGEVIFTFDGDEAGQSAALKVFSGDQNFLAQTYVAVEPSGLDPCDLRLQQGDAAVRELVARRVPLYRFVMSNIVHRYDLDRADGRLNALRAAAPLVGAIRDRGLVSGYIRELTGLLGMEPEEVQREVSRAARAPRPQGKGDRGRQYDNRRGDAGPEQLPADQPAPRRPAGPELPDPNDRLLTTERQTLKLIIQAPQRFGPGWDGVSATDFTHPAYAAVFTGVEKAAADGIDGDWAHRVSVAADDDRIRSLTVSLAVEPLPITGEPTDRVVAAYSSGLQLLTVMRQIAELKSKLQRTNPVEHATRYNQMFSELVVLEARRHALHQRSIGTQDS